MIHMIFVKSLVLLYFENPGFGKIVIYVPEFVILGKNLHFYEIRKDFKIDFSIPLFTIIFRQKMALLDTDE